MRPLHIRSHSRWDYLRCLLFFGIGFATAGCRPSVQNLPRDSTVIIGATILNLSDHGTQVHDISGKAIVIAGDTVFSVIDERSLNLTGSRIVDASGKIIIPGLIDGFAVINNQSYANAFLFKGITDIIGVESERRGAFFHDADPGPTVHMLRQVGDVPIDDDEIIRCIDSLSAQDTEVLLLMYKLRPRQVRRAVKHARQLGMGTIGELGYTSYEDGIDAGIDAFVHTTRYSLDVAPDPLARAVADEPFSDLFDSPKWQYYRYLSELDTGDPELTAFAARIGSSETFLMPTFALLYLDMPFSQNPWDENVAAIIDASDINLPASPTTGKHPDPEGARQAYQELGLNVLSIERLYAASGAKYLTGSATDVWGTMPGISLYQEMEMLSRAGLTNREILAAATNNFAEAFGIRFGRIRTGYAANILILNSNPIEDLKHLDRIHTLFLRGKEIDRQALLR